MPDRDNRPPLSPSALSELQAWFGRAISQPLPREYPGNPLSVSRPDLEPEADARLNGKGGLSGFARLGVYNQQYWFRLITIMQGEYPCAVHILGLREFNQWVIRFLQAHPPASPFLANLDLDFLSFMEAEYREGNREAALQSIAFDRALSKAFDAPEGMALSAAGITDPGALMSRKLALAPHAALLRLGYDFDAYRARCLADESLEAEIELKPLEKEVCLVHYRNEDLELRQQPVTAAALAVLQEFRTPSLLGEAFERLDGKLSAAEQSELETGLAGWFQDWVARGWLCLADGAESDHVNIKVT